MVVDLYPKAHAIALTAKISRFARIKSGDVLLVWLTRG